MRKLKLQVQTSVDGFMGSEDGKLDWLQWNWTDDIGDYVNFIHAPVDCILLGRKMAEGFITAWEARLADPKFADFAKIMVNTPKIIFSKTLESIKGQNTELVKEDSIEYISKLKNKPGSDIIVYGGSSFVSSLINADIIDEYHLFINPTAIGKGMTIFGKLDEYQRLSLKNAKILTAVSQCFVMNLHEDKMIVPYLNHNKL